MNESLPPNTDSGEQQVLDDAVVATDRFMESIREVRKEREQEGERIPVRFVAPGSVQVKLSAEEQEYSDDFDRLDSTRPSHVTIRAELARKGKRPAPTAEEIEQSEVAEISKNAASVHEPRTKATNVKMRPLGPNQRNTADGDKRVETVYGKPGEVL